MTQELPGPTMEPKMLTTYQASESPVITCSIVERLIWNARRLVLDANSVALALELVAPTPGREWRALCCSCLDRTAHDTPDEHVHRIYMHAWERGADCWGCAYSGPDVLVAALAK